MDREELLQLIEGRDAVISFGRPGLGIALEAEGICIVDGDIHCDAGHVCIDWGRVSGIKMEGNGDFLIFLKDGNISISIV